MEKETKGRGKVQEKVEETVEGINPATGQHYIISPVTGRAYDIKTADRVYL